MYTRECETKSNLWITSDVKKFKFRQKTLIIYKANFLYLYLCTTVIYMVQNSTGQTADHFDLWPAEYNGVPERWHRGGSEDQNVWFAALGERILRQRDGGG